MSAANGSSTTVAEYQSSPHSIASSSCGQFANHIDQSPSDDSVRLHYSPPKILDDLRDPFLAQYLKPSISNNHELYFKSLNRQTRINSFDYYSQYLKQNKVRTPSLVLRKSPDGKLGKTPSPLRNDLTPEALVKTPSVEPGSGSLSRRRRRPTESLSPAGTKKSHPEVTTVVLTEQFTECATADLINLISRMIQSLINLNDKSVPETISNPLVSTSGDSNKKLLTRYHSRTPPAISIHTYLTRLTKFNNFSQTTLLATIYYIDLLSHNFQPFFTLNSWTVHRFLLVATMLAQKSLEDFFYTNDHYAKVGGVALTEINCLELDFLNRVNWKVVPAKQISPTETSIKHSKEVLDLYYWQLVTLMGKNVTEQNNVIYQLPAELENAA